MTDYDNVHYLTEAIYKNVLENYNPGVKQLISTGRALQKALHNVATHAKTYVDCIYTLAQSAQVCKGATSEIGAALLQIAEVHKEINTQVIDNIKSFHSDLLIPLETKQENDFKHLQLVHKKYCTGHKLHRSVYEKSQNALKKHKKKAKAKFGFDQKELQYAREVKENSQKLEDYQLQNLRLVLLEERKRYCFLLDRVCAMVRNYASHHSKAHEMFTHRLPEWTEMCRSPHILPETSEAVINAFRNQQDELYNTPEELPDIERRSSSDYTDRQQSSSGHGDDSNSFTYGTSHRLQAMQNREALGPAPTAFNPGLTNGGLQSLTDEYMVSGMNSGIAIPSPSPQSKQVRAVYTHSGVGETQLSFVTGDRITLIGEKRDGWQYGENSRTRIMGWFPISFTESIHDDANLQPTQDFRLTTQRVKSLGNLSDLREVNQDYRMNVHSSGHSDSDSLSIKMRGRHREPNVPDGRPMSMHANVMQTPQKFRDADDKGNGWKTASIGKRHSYHPRQPSIPEDDDSHAAQGAPRVSKPSAYRMLSVPSSVSQRHTLAYATSPVSDIYLGRRHSTVEQTSQNRANSLLPNQNSRFLQRLKEGGIGQRTSLVMATDLAVSSNSQIPEITCIPPPEEFRDFSEERSGTKNSHIACGHEDVQPEMMHPKNDHNPRPQYTGPPMQEPQLPPPPPPPLPPPNSISPGGGHSHWHGPPPLLHTASHPSILKHRNERSNSVPHSHFDPQMSRVNHQGAAPSTYAPAQHEAGRAMQPGAASHAGGAHNPDYISRSEMNHMAPPQSGFGSNCSPSSANSSSGYSSGTTQTGSATSHNHQNTARHPPTELPPPPPQPLLPHLQPPAPHSPHIGYTINPPPPPPVPPPNPGMGHHNNQESPYARPRIVRKSSTNEQRTPNMTY